MYAGDIEDGSAMHHMLYEVLGKSIDEYLRGFGTNVRIAIDGDRICVEDDGRGIPLETIELLLTDPRAHGYPHVSHRTHPPFVFAQLGVGMALANALSSELEITVWRDGFEHVQRYARGEQVTPVQTLGATTRTGTCIAFTPDFTIFTPHPWDVGLIAERCRQFAALLPGLAISLVDDVYQYASVVDYVRELAACDVIEPFHVCTHERDVTIELALVWAQHGEWQSFVNCIPCEHGVHVDAVRSAIHTVLGRRAKTFDMARLVHRLVGVLHVSVRDPQFNHQTRERLMNRQVGEIVRGIVERELARHLEATPALLDRILIDLE